MSEEIPKPLVINGFLASTNATYTKSTLTIDHKIHAISYWGTFTITAILFTVIFLSCSALFNALPNNFFNMFFFYIIGVIISGLILCEIIQKHPYRYEFDKERKEFRCEQGSIFGGIFTNKKKLTVHPLSDIRYIRVVQITKLDTHDTFKLQMVVKYSRELELPAGNSLNKCIRAANIYRDFLEISSPIKFPE